MSGRGDVVPPPLLPGEYQLFFSDLEAAKGWEQLTAQFATGTRDAWESLRKTPTVRGPMQKPLQGQLTRRTMKGRELPQWQRDVSSSARVWYVVDEQNAEVHITLAKTGHPGATDGRKGRGKRTSKNR